MTKKLLVSASLLAKSQVAAYTRKDGVMVQAHDNGRTAAAPKPLPSHVKKMISDVAQSPAKPEHKKAAIDAIVAQHAGGAAAPKPAAKVGVRASVAKKAAPAAGGYSVAPFKHGGHQIKEPDGTHHVILQDKGMADRHAGALNHVAQSGKDAHMNEAVSAAGKKHLHLDSFDEVGRDSEDFVDTGKGGLKAALHHAYDAGAGHSNGGAHRDAVVAEAAKHFAGFDSLEQEGRDHLDFKETSKGLLKHALKHAYASAAQKHAK